MNINVVLPDDIRAYVEAQLAAGVYGDINEYFLDLVRQDQRRKAQEKLEALLEEGINSDSQEVTPEYWQSLRESVLGQNNSRTADNA